MEQSFLTYYRSKLETVPDKGLIKILAKQRLDSCLQIVKEDYDMEYSLYLVKQIGVYAGGGTERLIVNAPKQGVVISSPMCVKLSENKFSGGTHERRKNNHMGRADPCLPE